MSQAAAQEAVRLIDRGQQAASFAADLTAARAARNGTKPDQGGVVIEVLTTREVCALPAPTTSDELLGELVVRGTRVVIGGQTGEGKTTLALTIVRAIALAQNFLGWTGAGGRALVLDAEQGLKTVKRRLTELGLSDTDDVDYVCVPDGLSLDVDPGHIAAVEAVLATGDYNVVLADPLYKLHAGDSNAEREAVDLMRRFDAWRERYRFALILPVHCRKTPVGAKFSLQEFFGSSAYLRGAEVALGLQRLRAGYSRLHFFKDRDGDLPIGDQWGLLFDRENGYRRDPEDDKPKQTAADTVRELLQAQPDMTIGQLEAATGYAERTIRKALKEIGANDRRPGQRAEPVWNLDTAA